MKIVTPGGQLQDVTRTLDVNRTPNNARHTIVDESTSLTDRATLRFTGAGVTASDDAGNGRTNVTIPGAATTVATDTIWDAAGDIVKGTGADTAARVARGSALQMLRVNSGGTDIEWGNPAVADLSDGYGGTGSPEGVVTAPVGSVFLRTDGGSGTTLYVKESGSGNTGWRAMSSGARLLGGAGGGAGTYDPGTAATASTASLLAMTALDTTNLRAAITAPASGKVRCVMGVGAKALGSQSILLGVMDGATVKLRLIADQNHLNTGVATLMYSVQAEGIISGLTPGNSYNLDLAYGVEGIITSGTIGWGGPNNTTGADAYGAAIFEVWEVVA